MKSLAVFLGLGLFLAGVTPLCLAQSTTGAPDAAPDAAPPLFNPAPLSTPTPAPEEEIPTTEFNPYIRASVGRTNKGGAQVNFFLPGASAKYRLGNENEIYSELQLGQQFAKFDNGLRLKGVTRLALFNNVNRFPTFSGNIGNRNFAEAYLEANHIPDLPGARLWAGRIYYRREDIHINDFFYWNPSGLGAGLENVKVGKVRASSALFRNDSRNQVTDTNRHDLRVSQIPVNRNGELEVGVSLIQKPSSLAGSHGGWALIAQHRQANFLGGSNKFAVQYGVGPGIGLGQTGDLLAGRDSHRLRFINAYDWQGKRFGGQLGAVYQRTSLPNDKQEWMSLGVRPVYAFSKNFKLAVELGHDRVRPQNGDTRTLTKITIAPTLSKGKGFYDRPEIRFFYTYARWNRAAQNASAAGQTLSADGPFGGSRQGSTFGLQLELW